MFTFCLESEIFPEDQEEEKQIVREWMSDENILSPFHLVSKQKVFRLQQTTVFRKPKKDGARGRLTEGMTLMDKMKGGGGKESDTDRVKERIREFNGEEDAVSYIFSRDLRPKWRIFSVA